MTFPFTPSDELVEKGAIAIAEAQGLHWDTMCDAEPFPRHWEGTLVTHEDCRVESRAAIAVIARELGEEAAKVADESESIVTAPGVYREGYNRAKISIAAAIRAKFGVPSAPTPRERGK